MKLEAVVRYRGVWAYYNISPKRTGICEAQVIKWEGEGQPAPPEHIFTSQEHTALGR